MAATPQHVDVQLDLVTPREGRIVATITVPVKVTLVPHEEGDADG